jgi:hypothetical protein
MRYTQWYPLRLEGTFAFVSAEVLSDNSQVFDVYTRNTEGLPGLVLHAEDEAHAAAVANALNAAIETRAGQYA